MNFVNVKNLVIPEGSVKQIADSLGTVLWKKNEKFHIKNTDTKQITVTIKKSNTDAPTISLEVSDDGITWTTLGVTSTTGRNITLPVGGKKYIRSTSSNAWCSKPNSIYVSNRFSSTGKFSANGNIMELLGYDTLKGLDCAYMFYDCSYLTKAPVLPVTTLAERCYSYMFRGCTSLTTAPVLPATTMVSSCYNGMFYGCTALTIAPELPATTLAEHCYNNMFNGCTALTTAPALPVTTLANNCYYYMFQNCTSLTTAPELPATTLVSNCYGYMFYGCSRLNYIRCLATNISATNPTLNWVSGVAASGTFVKATSMSGWTTGANGIPSGWTVQNI